MSGRVENKVVIVTGGARGQGAAQVRALHAEGARVVVADVLDDDGTGLAAGLGERCRFVHCDVTDEADWDRLVGETTRAFGRLDGLVHGAGVFTPVPLVDTSIEQFRRALDVNATGAFLGLRTAARVMRDGGSVVVVTSTAAHSPSGLSLASYAASKWAARGLAHTCAIELAPLGIRVNTVAPGSIRTRMITDALSEDALLGLAARAPLGRLGTAEDVAPLVVFLMSDESNYCTGADFVVDGGMTAGYYRGP